MDTTRLARVPPSQAGRPSRRGRAVLLVAATVLGGSGRLAGQTHLSLAAGVGRLHQSSGCGVCGNGSSDGIGVVSARLTFPIETTIETGILAQIGFGVGAPAGSQRIHTLALLAGLSTPRRRAGPWGQLGLGGALVPGTCNVMIARVAGLGSSGAARRSAALDDYGPFDIACGHDARGAAQLSAGLNVPIGRHFVGPEVGAMVTTGDGRFTLLTAGIAFRF